MKRILPYLSSMIFLFGYAFVQGQATINVTAGATDNTVNGNCSLREAVESANTNSAVDACTAGQSGGVDVINIPDGTYDLSTSGGTDIHLSSSLTLNGTSEALTIIQAHANSGTATDRVFLVDAVDIDVTFEDMTVEHGRFTSTGVNRRGAGIGIDSGGGASTGTVTLTRVTVDQNETAAGGGGINVEDNLATLTLTDCTISNNSAFNAGGIRNDGAATVNMTDCIFNGNTTSNNGGGGLRVEFPSSTNTFTNCSFLNNTVPNNNTDSDGGAAYIEDGTNTFINCTFSGNSVADNGGAISNRATGTGLYNCTIVNNSTTSGNGGGLFTNQAMTVTNTIIANNTATGTGNDVQSSATITETTSLAENCSGTCPSWSYTSDPNLAVAATCGSPAQTYFEPQAPSDAINTGTAPGGSIPATDICGTAVLQSKDIGSREVASNALDFDGTDDYVSCGDIAAADGATELTMEAWVKFDALTGFSRIIVKEQNGSNTDGTGITLTTGGQGFRFLARNGSDAYGETGNILSTGTWTHVAFVYDGSGASNADKLSCYVNGAVQGLTFSGTIPATLTNNNFDLTLGANSAGSSGFMDGCIDEARIWNVALEAADIASLYNDSFSDPTSPASCLVAYYQMEHSTGSSLSDVTGNGNTGTLTNMMNDDWVASGASTTITTAPACASLLPVDLVNFRARVQDNQSILSWSTAYEFNNEGFEIEWSTDNQSWKNIGFVQGIGESYELNNYQFVHERPAAGINYYRLKQMDYDGVFDYSSVVSIDLLNLGDLAKLRVAPNPTQDGSFTLYLPENLSEQNWAVEAENIQMQITDYAGRLIEEQTIIGNQSAIDVGNLSPGLYLIQVQIGGQRFFEKVLVQ